MGYRTKVRMSEYTPAEAARGATFQAATTGLFKISAWRIAKAFNELRPGETIITPTASEPGTNQRR